MSQAGSFGNSGGGGGGDVTISGDTGSIMGSNLTIFSNIAANNAGASVSFDNGGTTSLFNTTDALRNVWIGTGAGVLGAQTGQNVGVGGFALGSVTDTTSGNNVAIGDSALLGLNDGAGSNTCVGSGALLSLVDGDNNIAVGFSAGNAYTGTESQNICLGNPGVAGDMGSMRLGNINTTETFVEGVASVAVENLLGVTIDSATGQLGSAPGVTFTLKSSLVDGTSGTVQPLFVSPSYGTFVVTAIIEYGQNVSGVISPAFYNIGWTATDYDDLVQSGGTQIDSTNIYSSQFPGGSIQPTPIPPSTTVSFNVTTPATATTMDLYIYVTGYILF